MSNADVDRSRLAATVVYFCTAVSVGVTLFRRPGVWYVDDAVALTNFLGISAWVGAFGFLIAGLLVFRAASRAYRLGLFAAVVTLPWFVRQEAITPWSSWMMLNYTGPAQDIPSFIDWKILAVALVAIAAACSSIRLLPARWMFRNAPWRWRTWPAFAVGFLAMAVWFVCSAMPYSRPAFHDGIRSEFTILRVEKRGLHFRETLISEFRDERIWICRSDRRLFQYRFEENCGSTTLSAAPGTVQVRGRSFVQSAESWRVHTPLPKALRAWNAEGWYVSLKDAQVMSFTSEAGTAPPLGIVELFHGMEGMTLSEQPAFTVRDVCLGFCYDPLAALGLSSLKARTRLMERYQAGALILSR